MKNIMNKEDKINLRRLPRNYTTYADFYLYTMNDAYDYADRGKNEAVFDVFFRKIPNDGGYAVMAGIDKLIEYIKNLRFTKEDLKYLKECGLSDRYLDVLKDFRFCGDIKAVPDGTPVFPNEPIVTVKGSLLEVDLIETAILALVNGSMEHATGARRIVEATPKDVPIMEFGARRADGFEAGIDASIYGVMAGCAGTSNVIAGRIMNRKALGTMAHHFIQTFEKKPKDLKYVFNTLDKEEMEKLNRRNSTDGEFKAFKSFVDVFPKNAILLVDTIDTLRSGVPNAIRTFNYMKEKGMPLDNIGIRIDSGDLAYLSKESRKMMDEAGFPQAKICLSNGLNAATIEALRSQGAVFNSLGVGDNISKPEGRMGCVYKEVALKEDGEWDPRIKLSNDTFKITNPGFKNLYRLYDKKTGYALADVMDFEGKEIPKDNMTILNPADPLQSTFVENYDVKELQRYIFKDGKQVYEDPSMDEKRAYCEEEMNRLYPEVRRELNPHIYKVSGTKDYVDYKEDMIEDFKGRVYRKER